MAARKSRKPTITDATVASLTFMPGKSPLLWDAGDSSCPRFFARVTPSGGKQYGVRYRIGGRQRSYSLGPVDKWKTVGDAREHARALLKRLDQDGIDPAHGGDGTMQAVIDHYVAGLKDGSARRKMKGHAASVKTVSGVESAWRTHFEKSIGQLTPKDVTGAVIRNLHAKITSAKRVPVEGRGSRKRGGLYAANRAIAYLRAAWNASASDGLTQGLPDPFVGLVRNHEKVRDVILRKSDAPAFLQAIEQEPEPFRSYWWLMMLLGPRGSELRSLTWDDADAGVVRFRDTKNGTTHELPLPNDAIEILAALPRHGRRVFPFTYPNSSWERIRKRTGLAELRPHDVRRTVGSWLGAAGLSSSQVGALLNHKSDITSKVYIKLAADADTKAAAAETQSELVRKFGGNVVPFPTKGTGEPKERQKA